MSENLNKRITESAVVAWLLVAAAVRKT